MENVLKAANISSPTVGMDRWLLRIRIALLVVIQTVAPALSSPYNEVTMLHSVEDAGQE